MEEERQILVVSKPGAPWLGALRSHATSEAWPVSVQTKTLDALTWLDENRPWAIVIDGTVSHAPTLCVLARAKPAIADVPILSLVPVVDDTAFSRWLLVGVDDVLLATASSRIIERLRGLPPASSSRPTPYRGVAVVADTDPARCDVVGRVLAYAGYDVRLALDATRLVEYASEPDVQLVIASTTIGDPASLIERVRSGATLPAWVVGDPSLESWANPRPFAKVQRAAVMSARAQPDAVLFASNALLLASGRRARGSTRLLYGTTVGFRVNGKADAEVGYTFNISATGLFVRTLAPPPPGDVTLELAPPGTNKRVKFMGEVIWNRPFGNRPGATTPPGFGARLLDAQPAVMTAWLRDYETLAARSGAPQMDEREMDSELDPLELEPALMKPDAPRPRAPRSAGPKLPARNPPPPPPVVRASGAVGERPKRAASKPPPLPTTPEPTPKPPPVPAPTPPVPVQPEPPPVPTQPEPLPTPPPVPVQPEPPPVPNQPEAPPTPEELPAPAAPEVPAPESPPVVQPSAPMVEPSPERPSRLPFKIAIGALAITALGIGAWIAMDGAEGSTSASPAAPPSAAPAGTKPPQDVAAVPPPAQSASPSPDTSASAGATDPGSCPQIASEEGQSLLTYEGYLIVCSSASLDVYVSGVRVGRTNEKLVARCPLKFVRLGEGSPVVWRTEGTSMNIACRGATRVTLEPSP